MTRIALGPANGQVYRPSYAMSFFRQGNPARKVTGLDLQSGLSIQTSKNLQDLAGTFTITLKDPATLRKITRMDVVRIRLRGHNPDLTTVLVGVVDGVIPSMGAGPSSAQQTYTVTGRCTAKYLQTTSLFRPVWDPSNNIPTALTFGKGDPTSKTGSSPRAIFGYLLRNYTYGKRGMVGESGIPNSRFWLDYKKRFEHIGYEVPFMQFDEEDMGSVLKRFEILGYTEAWVDEVGHIVYRQPQWDAPAAFTLDTGAMTTSSFPESDVEVKTYVEVIPGANPGISSALSQALLAGRAPVPSSYLQSAEAADTAGAAGAQVADADYIIDTDAHGKVTAKGLTNPHYRRQLQLGVRPMQITSPLLYTQEQAQQQAQGLLQFFSRMTKTATITIPGDPRVRMGANVYVHGRVDGRLLRRSFYIEGVQHDYSEGSHYDTVLDLTHGRDPGDPKWGNIVLSNASVQDLASAGGVQQNPAAGGDLQDPGGSPGVPGQKGNVKADPGNGSFTAQTTRPDGKRVYPNPGLTAFLALLAGAIGKTLYTNTYSRHGQFTANGGQSDHWLGNGCDLHTTPPNDSSLGDSICFQALRLCGVPSSTARSLSTTACDFPRYPWTDPDTGKKYSVQVGWRVDGHHDHVHVGVR